MIKEIHIKNFLFKFCILFLLYMLIPSLYSEAKTPSPKKYYNLGIYFNSSFDQHELLLMKMERLGLSAFPILPIGYSISSGVVLESDKSPLLTIGASLGYITTGISSSMLYSGGKVVQGPNGQFHYYSDKRTLQTEINKSDLYFSPYIIYKVLNDIDIKTGFAFCTFTNVNYNMKVVMVSSTNPNETPGVIDEINEEQKLKSPYAFVSFFLGLSNDFPLDLEQTIIFSPSLEYKIGLNKFENSKNWEINSLVASLVLKYKI